MIDHKLIRSLRQKRSMTLQDLAQQAGLSVSYLSEIELGKKQPSLETIDKLAQALNISREGLISSSSAGAGGIGAKIALIRQEKNLSLSELAEKVGISPSYLCQIESGRAMPALSTLKSIAKALDVKPENLMAATSFVGYKIKKIRCERKITQAELAEKAGVSTGLIGQIESGKVEPSIKTLEKIAAALSLSPCFFVSEDEELSSILKPMNPEVRELLNDPKVRSALELLADCSAEEFSFILKFIQLYKEHRES
ncbi:MAG: transcriptional regulator [Tepidanaerobacter acetatoxydans]|jgi:transcriptional regulator with XRE-family HTH domain|uniref:helix-turn-helix domain-containing protein n=1 Tax=Tepidanaerobacter acetatoxydans TaxID=499229 RepID=UPI0026F070F8|nr:helix-turn-helix transcriptional regulator [Tepidanaerobacter acetatoxydans]NLU10327.1 transcriptional regulator [Tepidanaerobacter acetatoxydans]